jgi:hypothetical protein
MDLMGYGLPLVVGCLVHILALIGHLEVMQQSSQLSWLDTNDARQLIQASELKAVAGTLVTKKL